MSKITKLRGICLQKRNFVEGRAKVTAMWGSVTLITDSSSSDYSDAESNSDITASLMQDEPTSTDNSPDTERMSRNHEHDIDDTGTITVEYKATNKITWDDGGVDESGIKLCALDFTYSPDDGVYYSALPPPDNGDCDDQQWLRIIIVKKTGRI